MSACHLPTPAMAAVSPHSLRCQATQLMVLINHSTGYVLESYLNAMWGWPGRWLGDIPFSWDKPTSNRQPLTCLSPDVADGEDTGMLQWFTVSSVTALTLHHSPNKGSPQPVLNQSCGVWEGKILNQQTHRCCKLVVCLWNRACSGL